jgi:hypothetical protein
MRFLQYAKSKILLLENLQISNSNGYEEVKKSAKISIRFLRSNLDVNSNLFNGDNTLGDNVNKVMIDNGREVFDEWEGRPY